MPSAVHHIISHFPKESRRFQRFLSLSNTLSPQYVLPRKNFPALYMHLQMLLNAGPHIHHTSSSSKRNVLPWRSIVATGILPGMPLALPGIFKSFSFLMGQHFSPSTGPGLPHLSTLTFPPASAGSQRTHSYFSPDKLCAGLRLPQNYPRAPARYIPYAKTIQASALRGRRPPPFPCLQSGTVKTVSSFFLRFFSFNGLTTSHRPARICFSAC